MKRFGLVLAGVTILLAAGCSGDGSTSAGTTTVTVTPTVSMSSSPPTPTVAPPVLPTAAKQPTQAGAAAFVRHFWDLYNYSYRTMDPKPLRDVSKESCKFCSDAAVDIDSAVSQGYTFSGGEVAVLDVVAAPDDPLSGILVNCIIGQQASQVRRGDGQAVKTASGKARQRFDAAVQWHGDRWFVLGIEAVNVS